MIEFTGFTEKANKVLNDAIDIAKNLGHTYIGSEHILYGLLGEEKGMAFTILSAQGITQSEVLKRIEAIIGKGIPTELSLSEFTPRSKHVLETALTTARSWHHTYVGTEHILYAMLKDTECYATTFIRDMGGNINLILKECSNGTEKLKNNMRDDFSTQTKIKGSLSKFGRDLTELAKNNKIDPVIGREEEIERLTTVLMRRRKNNPCLIGESGVGKTAIVEGLALKIISGEVPELISKKRIFSLDISSMLAGAKYRGDFEERVKNAIDEVIQDGNIILFIDEVHSIIGAGAAEGAIDAASILKPMLARGELQLIGATTTNEYRRYIEKDSALERRFQPITIEEPTAVETKAILEKLKDKYEAYHKVKIASEAIDAAVELSIRYINDRFLPDKAIDLIDEAASRMSIKACTAPPELKALEQKLLKLEDEKSSAINMQDFEKAATFRDDEKQLRYDLVTLKSEWNNRGAFYGEVTAQKVSEVAALWSGVPISQLNTAEATRLLNLEDALSTRVIGQENAISSVAKAVIRGRAGLTDPNRPICSFIFLGATGVGKTELCKALAEQLFGSRLQLIRFDMSEYMEKQSISRLIGSPPGYVGFEDGGVLTEKVKRKPYSVILFDEIEKAHPDIYNLLLQILEDGILTSSQGVTVSFKNTVIIMTSNVGARIISEDKSALGFAESAKTDTSSRVMAELKKTFKPEFLNRVDETIIFNKLTADNILEICKKMLATVSDRAKQIGIELTFGSTVAEFIVSKRKNPEYGARPLRRIITEQIEDLLSLEKITNSIKQGDKVTIMVEEGHITIENNSNEKITI